MDGLAQKLISVPSSPLPTPKISNRKVLQDPSRDNISYYDDANESWMTEQNIIKNNYGAHIETHVLIVEDSYICAKALAK